MKYNLVVKYNTYLHVFDDFINLIKGGFEDLGIEVVVDKDMFSDEHVTIIFGAFNLTDDYAELLPPKTIIFNTEALNTKDPARRVWDNKVIHFAKHFEVWDYSKNNTEYLKSINSKNTKHFQLGYHKNLEDVQKNNPKDIGLFYGATSSRRLFILDQLKDKVIIKNSTFGKARAKLIAEAKAVLSIHATDCSILEYMRIVHLMANKKVVVAEVNDDTEVGIDILDGIVPCKYSNIVSTFNSVLDTKDLNTLENKAYETIIKYPQHEFLSRVLD